MGTLFSRELSRMDIFLRWKMPKILCLFYFSGDDFEFIGDDYMHGARAFHYCPGIQNRHQILGKIHLKFLSLLESSLEKRVPNFESFLEWTKN